MGKYADFPLWASVTPIPLDDGADSYATSEGADAGPIVPLVAIAYSEEYVEATAYLRAVMAADEMSDRALELTADVISLNPAHYTVWLYRASIIRALKKNLHEEIAWLNKISVQYLKNYQIWQHRQLIMSDSMVFPKIPETERDFLMQMFSLDAKNYHVWIYRTWLVTHFGLWDCPRELQDVDILIDSDVRNNSAWNHRWLLKFSPRDTNIGAREARGRLAVVDEDLVDAEIDYAKKKILIAPENRSPWTYIRGVLRGAGRPMAELKMFASKFVAEEIEGGEAVKYQVKSSLAVEWLADVLAEEAKANCKLTDAVQCNAQAVKMLNLLKEKYDPIRKNYWEYRIQAITNV
ncbi:CAAX geranylgeranyltransferase alpha subunit [Ophidiomyces ophidiicola]|nr:CAAX geranylgeranyltransferase alpha subunit [Ophidiomyces ophidiicola]KAI1928062.1 CAAX geranylgeranyltransferase alpha subunit [Ophidiomyces ophidiicola]KAI2017771.1 CAAX geranylgeranyltransferase alpha subunit [Ophidiomyces ophidiicola]KAI2032513.1 CAAX geranylgeranyltransferase alpha subunit [Ophidiomyces ophidiicola]KAI2062978.1 CAAX geranylgeranyltransferase alpha subunit [Ophidiomyces ophidiicola]